MAEGKEIEENQSVEVMNEEEWFNPLVAMANSQEQVAILLELANLVLKDHLNIAVEVRLLAQLAREQHIKTLRLIKAYKVTQSNILQTMVPSIKQAVELKSNEVLIPMLNKVLEFSQEMRDEAIKTRQSYYELQDEIQKLTAKISRVHFDVEDKQKQIEQERNHEGEQKRTIEEKLKELEKQRNEIEEEMRKYKEMRDEMFDKTVSGGAEMCQKIMELIMTPKFPDPTGKTIALQGLFGVLGLVVNTVREHLERKQAFEASERAQKIVNKASEDREKIEKEIYTAQKESLESGYKIELLDLNKSSLGDLETLVEAAEQLHKIDEELVNILTFWDNLAAFMKNLTQKKSVGGCFLDALENDTFTEMFNTELVKVEEGWVHFGSMCSKYVINAEQAVPRVYSFLSQPIEKMGIHERKKRSKELVEMLKAKLPVTGAPETPKIKDAN